MPDQSNIYQLRYFYLRCVLCALTYSGQMALYKEMLERVWPGKKIETVIWFVIAGSLVKVESNLNHR